VLQDFNKRKKPLGINTKRSRFRLAWSRPCTDLGQTELTSVCVCVQKRIAA